MIPIPAMENDKEKPIRVWLDLSTAPTAIYTFLNDHRLHNLFKEVVGCLPYAFYYDVEMEDLNVNDMIQSAIDGDDLDDISLKDSWAIIQIENDITEVIRWGINAFNCIRHPLIALIHSETARLIRESKAGYEVHGRQGKYTDPQTDFQMTSIIENPTTRKLELEMFVRDVEMWGSEPPEFYTPRLKLPNIETHHGY